MTALLLVGLVRSSVHITASHLRSLFWARPGSPVALERAAADILEHDEDRELLNSAVKGSDGFFTTFFVSTYSRYIARWAARRGLTPNQVTLFSIGLGVVAAACFANAERWSMVVGAVLVYFAFVFDCVDGQLARYTRQFSKLGAWLDSIFDRSKEYVVFAGLAIGASRTGDPAWLLAGAALALQTTRHAIDFSYPVSQHQVIAETPQPPLEDPFDGPRPASRLTEPVETEEVEEEDAEALPPVPARPTLKRRAGAAVAGDRPRRPRAGSRRSSSSRSASASPRSRSPPRSSTPAPSSSSCSPGAASRCSTSWPAARRGRWCHERHRDPLRRAGPRRPRQRARRLPRRRPARDRDRAGARPPHPAAADRAAGRRRAAAAARDRASRATARPRASWPAWWRGRCCSAGSPARAR